MGAASGSLSNAFGSFDAGIGDRIERVTGSAHTTATACRSRVRLPKEKRLEHMCIEREMRKLMLAVQSMKMNKYPHVQPRNADLTALKMIFSLFFRTTVLLSRTNRLTSSYR